MTIMNLRACIVLAAILPWILTSCATAYPKVGCGALGQAECIKLQAVAAQFPTRINAVPGFGEKNPYIQASYSGWQRIMILAGFSASPSQIFAT